jgi:hypothetical protein
MRALLLVTIAALPLAACDISKSSDDKNVNIQASEDGAVSFQIPGMKGNFKLPASMMRHSNMEIDGVKMYPGSSVNSVRAEDKIVTIGFTSPATVQKLMDYYGKEFAKAGVRASIQGNGFGGKTKDGDDFTLSFAETNGNTAGTMVIRDKDS